MHQKGGSQEAQAEAYTVLSTIHSAKGREWKRVRILSVVDGCIPSSRAVTPDAIEEERRLLYVAMTRAIDQLDLFVPQQLFHQYQLNGPGQHHVLLKLTRFIPSSIIGLFDRKVHQPSIRPKTSIGSTTLPRKRQATTSCLSNSIKQIRECGIGRYWRGQSYALVCPRSSNNSDFRSIRVRFRRIRSSMGATMTL